MKIQDAIALAIENIRKEGLTDVDVFGWPFELEMLKRLYKNNTLIFMARI